MHIKYGVQKFIFAGCNMSILKLIERGRGRIAFEELYERKKGFIG